MEVNVDKSADNNIITNEHTDALREAITLLNIYNPDVVIGSCNKNVGHIRTTLTELLQVVENSNK